MMPFRIGIGIITYNRRELVSGVIDRVRALTLDPEAALVIADDGSADGTLEMLREKQVPVVTGINKGVAWNKNRALFLLSHLLGCETVILLEDDAQPDSAGWESQWHAAAQRWGHVNFAGEWMREHFLSGSGTADDPVRSKMVTAQCAAYSKVALTYSGYFDSRFQGYGHEHVEHTRRLIRCGYGGVAEQHDGKERVVFKMITGGVGILPSTSHFRQDDVERNGRLAQQIMGRQDYRMPWADDRELRQFRAEMDSALSGGPDHFHLRGGPSRASFRRGRGLFRRLLFRKS